MSGGLIGGIIGAAIGFMIGMPQLGFMVGQLVGNALMPPEGQKGPKLSDLTPQSSEYGRPIPIVYGAVAVAGNVIWAMPYTEHENTSGGGKGGGSSATSYTYSANFAVSVCEGVKHVGKIYAGADKRLIWDGVKAESGTIRVYTGSDTQMPDPLIESDKGAGHAPAYRGTCYIVFENFMLDKDGNSLPFLWIEVGDLTVTVGSGGGGGGGGSPTYNSANVATYWESALRTAQGTPSAGTYIGLPVVWNPITSTFWQASTEDLITWGTADGTGDFAIIDPTIPGVVTGYTNGEPSIIAVNYAAYSGGEIYSLDSASRIRMYDATLGSMMAETNDTTYYWYDIAPAVGGGVWLSGARTSDNVGVYAHVPGGSATPDHIIVDPDTYSENCMAVNTLDGSLWLHNSVSMYRIDGGTFTIAAKTFDIDTSTEFPRQMVFNPGNGLFYMCGSSYTNYWIKSYNPATETIIADTEPTETQGVGMLYMNVENQLLFALSQFGLEAGRLTSRDLNTLAITNLDYQSPGSPGTFPDGVTDIGHMIMQDIPPVIGTGTVSVFFNFSNNSDIFEIGTGFVVVGGGGGGGTTTVDVAAPTLVNVITDLHTRSGLDPATSLDVSLMDNTLLVDGFVIAKQTDIRSSIDSLRPIFWFDAVESSGKVKYVPRGALTAIVIPEDDLAAFPGGGTSPQDPPDPLETTRQMDTELPRLLTVGYLLRATNYQNASKHQQRYHGSTGDGTEQTLEYSGVLSDLRGQQVADTLIYSSWSNRIKYKFQVSSRRYARMEPTDLVDIRGNIIRLNKVTMQDGYVVCEGVHENTLDYTLQYAQHAVTDADTIVKSIATPPATVTTL
jgi:hypothetical protein